MEGMEKPLAVEWLIERYKNRCFLTVEDYQKAKEMEKEQIIVAYIEGEHQQGFEGEAEQYYNETFKSE